MCTLCIWVVMRYPFSGLFQAVIPQSGCALSPFSVYRPPHSVHTTTRNLAVMLNCSVQSSRELVDCLRQKSATDIVVTYPEVSSTFGRFFNCVCYIFMDCFLFNSDIFNDCQKIRC
mgnify:CR=1 FL=1